MEPSTWIAVGALGLALVTFVATQFGSKRTATASYVSSLEKRIEVLEAENRTLRDRNNTLFEENLHLMRKLTENGRRDRP